MKENYITYLKFLEEKLDVFFESQKEYICCHKGCSLCCRHAEFPYSRLEMQYLAEGFFSLDEELQNLIESRFEVLKQEKKEFKGEKFLYDCPFLVDDACSVYEYRGVVCRTFGLLSQSSDGTVKTPFCCFKGLNYSKVFDHVTQQLSDEKVKELGYSQEPLGFNLSYEFLTNPDFERGFNILFGEKKPLLNWFCKSEN